MHVLKVLAIILHIKTQRNVFFTQNFVEAQRYLESGKCLTAYLEMSDGTMQTSTIISINEDELSFITKSGDEYLVKGIDNKINEIIVTSFYNKTKNERRKDREYINRAL